MRPKYNVDRRPDLDALRDTMILLVVVQFGALPFFDSPWAIQDDERSLWYIIPFMMGNGFLLQAFFVVSGFFTARLLRTRGLKEVLWNWLRYLLLPVALTAITILPVADWIFQRAVRDGLQESASSKSICTTGKEASIWCAAKEGDLLALKKHLFAGETDINALDPHFGFTPLTWATIAGHIDAAILLLKVGAKVRSKNHDGGTALHEAMFMGRDDVAELLLLKGADQAAVDNAGKVVLSRSTTKWGHVFAKMGKWRIEHDPRYIYYGRLTIANLFVSYRKDENVNTTTRVKVPYSSPCMATVGTQVSNLSSLVLMAFVPVVTYLCVSVCLLHATLARLATAVVFFVVLCRTKPERGTTSPILPSGFTLPIYRCCCWCKTA